MDCWTPPEYVPVDEDGNPGRYWNGQFIPFDKWDEDSYMVSFYGMEDFFYKELDVWKGETDPQVIKEKLETGKYLVYTVATDDNDFILEDEVMHQPGDKITLLYGDGQEREFEILSLVKENYYGMTNRMGSDFSYYTSADVFKEMASDQFLMSYAFNAEDAKEAEIASYLETYTTQEEPLMHYESKQYWLDEFSGLTGLFILVGGVLSFVVGIIGVLNFINSILTGIVTRQREFAMLESIGMTRKQLSKMLVLEGLYYAIATIVFSLVFGCLFSVTVLKMLTEGMWFMQYHFVILPMLFVFPVLLLLGIVVPKAALYFTKKESVVERLRRTE